MTLSQQCVQPEATVWDRPLQGLNLPAATLGALAQSPRLLVFLRHFGCIFCREIVADLRKVSQARADYPALVFVFQEKPAQGERFFQQLWPGVAALSDPSQTLYKAFGLARGSWQELFGPGVWQCGWRAVRKGHFVGAASSDPFQMPGLFYVYQRQVYWQHDCAHAGDHPDFRRLPAVLPALPAAAGARRS
jgi:hypothetical protein